MTDSKTGICVLIPTYRNAGTIVDVVRRTLSFCDNVIVVVDGSPDATSEILKESELPVTVLEHKINLGKGRALKTGLEYARSKGYDYAITLDSDNQHFPEDIPLFINACKNNPGALILGSRNLKASNMPGKNTFANRFSNFWFALQTLKAVPDTQTGFRAYPLKSLPCLSLLTSRYEAELELLVLMAWKGVKIVPVDIRVFYPDIEERISSFRPICDFIRISILNIILCLTSIVYGYPRMLCSKVSTLWKS